MNRINLKLILLFGLIGTSMAVQSDEDSCNMALGETIYKKCAVCHTNDDGAEHLVGPNLYGLMNRMSGTSKDFSYSLAMLEAPRKWTPEALDEFLEKPMTVIPGSTMAFAGIRKPHQRAAVICYLNSGKTP
jgi:cytochrome c